MDIHRPKPRHGFREFLKEHGIIVLDLLTALADEQAVGAIHWRGEVAEAREALKVELADPNGRAQAITALRALIGRIMLMPNPDGRGAAIEVEGRLAGILALAAGHEPPEALTAKTERVKGIEPSS